VYNALGQEVITLVDHEYLPAGEHSVIWNGADNSGNTVSSGMYFYRLESGDQVVSNKMIMIK
jgi:flagellar hook assembly protein FlgD